jgi:uncharacterized protein YrrD
MLFKSKTIRNYKLSGIDGEVGSVKEFYFDDKYWTLRYLIANTGGWLNNRQVLISPYFLKNVDYDSERIYVDLTRNQIENSPSLEQDVPVSRQYEESYYNYYGTPLYWDGPNMWGANPYILRDKEKWSATLRGSSIGSHDSEMAGTAGNQSTGTNTDPVNSGNTVNTGGITNDSNLRSSKEVSGYKIHATDEDKIGHVDDFIIDDDTWAIRYLIINTGNVFTGKKVLISPEWIDHISWDDSKVYINLSKEEIKQSPEYSDESGLTRDYESSLFGYYKKTPYWSPEPHAHDYTHSQVDTEGKYTGY